MELSSSNMKKTSTIFLTKSFFYTFSKESFSYIFSNEPLDFSLQAQKFKKNPPQEKFLIFQEMENQQKFLVFSKKKAFLIF